MLQNEIKIKQIANSVCGLTQTLLKLLKPITYMIKIKHLCAETARVRP
jgi:hypothetical protein